MWKLCNISLNTRGDQWSKLFISDKPHWHITCDRVIDRKLFQFMSGVKLFERETPAAGASDSGIILVWRRQYLREGAMIGCFRHQSIQENEIVLTFCMVSSLQKWVLLFISFKKSSLGMSQHVKYLQFLQSIYFLIKCPLLCTYFKNCFSEE